jgi:Family of unknown function (DUF5677)
MLDELNEFPELIAGNPDEWKRFAERHRMFYERFPHLRTALHAAFLRGGQSDQPIDRFICLYGRLCCDDFFEVLLCAANGYGAAALKLLRTLYERAVTLRYLHNHSDELPAFIDFQKIQDFKLMVAVEKTFPGMMPAEKVAQVRANRDEVKEYFTIPVCEECGTERVNHSWNRLDFVAMAATVPSLGNIIVPGYYMPLTHAHATLGALTTRLDNTSDVLAFDPEPQRGLADNALLVAHNVILDVIDVQKERFDVPGLAAQLQLCMQDFLDISKSREEPTKPVSGA